MSDRGFVYLLHFDAPLAHASHYMGSTNRLKHRLNEHAAGRGARLVQVFNELGIAHRVARVWKHPTLRAARLHEAQLKRHNHGPRMCPVCSTPPAPARAREVTA